jgi:hypothetical protein
MKRQCWVVLQILLSCVCLYLFMYPHPSGSAVTILAFAAVAMTLHEKMGPIAKGAWIFLALMLVMIELHSINNDRNDQNTTFREIADGIKKEADKSDQIIQILEVLSRRQDISTIEQQQILAKAWGTVSELDTRAIEGAMPTLKDPPQIQQGKRFVSAETLGAALRNREPSSATIINDGTNDAGNFAKQLENGLQKSGWQVGGNNVKIGDPHFFPDSLTIEVSSNPASSEDRSIDEAKHLIAALESQGVRASLRFTALKFPPNFMRIKVAGL